VRVQVAIAIDTADPRYKRLIRLIEDLGENPHSPIEPDRGDAWEPPGSASAAELPGYDPREFIEEPFDPEGRAPARPSNWPDRGDAWEPPTEEEDPDQDAPRDGRQLLGWASKQIPDLKGVLIGYGKKKGLHSKIVEWTPQQVAVAYRFARARAASTR
jgi:hypothetical protein